MSTAANVPAWGVLFLNQNNSERSKKKTPARGSPRQAPRQVIEATVIGRDDEHCCQRHGLGRPFPKSKQQRAEQKENASPRQPTPSAAASDRSNGNRARR